MMLKKFLIAILLLSTFPAIAQTDSPPVAAPQGTDTGTGAAPQFTAPQTTAPQGTTIQNGTTPAVTGKHGKDKCRERVEAICPGVQPGGGRLMACLKQNNKTLAEVCPERAKHMQQKQSGQAVPGTQAPVADPLSTQ